ncbi:MAG TPA: hypothetical protein PKO22_02755 [Treponemataceae bacterium]|nr:hypothetical protein [Treponemataceae bacterium]
MRSLNTFARLGAIAFACCAAFLSGCVQAKPSIIACDAKLLRVQGPAGTFAERLSLFVLPRDDDGDADFGSIDLVHGESGLTWSINIENAMVSIKGKDRWIGTNAISGPGDGQLPSGSYTVTYNDLAGNETIRAIELIPPRFPARAPVTFRVNGSNWVVEKNPDCGDFVRTWLFLLDGKSGVLQSWKVPDGTGQQTEGSIESLQMMAMQAVAVQCYTENIAGTAGVLLTPVDLR